MAPRTRHRSCQHPAGRRALLWAIAASRDLARQHGRRARRAAHRRMRTRAHESRAPGAEARLDAQRAQQPRDDRLPRAHMHETAHASDALLTRSARAASRSAAAGRSASRQSHRLNGLRRGGCKWGTRRDTIIAPLPPTEWPRQWSGWDGSAWPASAFDMTLETHLEPNMCVYILRCKNIEGAWETMCMHNASAHPSCSGIRSRHRRRLVSTWRWAGRACKPTTLPRSAACACASTSRK